MERTARDKFVQRVAFYLTDRDLFTLCNIQEFAQHAIAFCAACYKNALHIRPCTQRLKDGIASKYHVFVLCLCATFIQNYFTFFHVVPCPLSAISTPISVSCLRTLSASA